MKRQGLGTHAEYSQQACRADARGTLERGRPALDERETRSFHLVAGKPKFLIRAKESVNDMCPRYPLHQSRSTAIIRTTDAWRIHAGGR